ncbi:MAG: GNAT family N-acetyltransferase [Actinobacteria bacterium]|nr:GNAT family N-acetyltransferase [Actinomycetota bacterium]
MQVRRLDPADDVAMAGRIVQQAYGALENYPADEAYHEVIGDVAGRAGESDVVVAVDDDGSIVGCLTFVAGQGDADYEFDDPDAASFRYFGVGLTSQGRGIGEAMVSWVIDEARRIGRRRIRIHTLESMLGAQRLYERLGFVRDPATDADWDGIIGLAYVYDLA